MKKGIRDVTKSVKPKKIAVPRKSKIASVDAVKPVAKIATPELVVEAKSYSAAFCFVGNDSTRLWGMTAAERARKLLAREGVTQELSLEQASTYPGPLVIMRADAVIDGALIPALAKRPNFILVSSTQALAANVRAADLPLIVDILESKVTADGGKFLVRSPEELQVSFKKSLVKRETPFALRISGTNVRSVEWDMFMSTYKGATDLVTKHVWPVPAFHVTRFLAAKGITPNAVTTVGAVSMLIAFYLFLQGNYATGLLFAWFMTFLDTVDGKLARTTLTSSFWGDIFDHGIDLVHPPFWYLAWVLGMTTWNIEWPQEKIIWILVVIFGGYILQRVMEGIAIKWLGLVIHIWRPIDTLFRKVTARRNPNLLILSLFTVLQRPDWGIVAVAVWTVICLALHGIQLAQALLAVSRNGSPLKSWMQEN